MRGCCTEAQRPSRSGLEEVLLARWRSATSPRTGEMEGGVEKQKRACITNSVMASFHFITGCITIHQGVPGAVAPPPTRDGGLEQDGGGGHRHKLFKGIRHCRGELGALWQRRAKNTWMKCTCSIDPLYLNGSFEKVIAVAKVSEKRL